MALRREGMEIKKYGNMEIWKYGSSHARECQATPPPALLPYFMEIWK
jgi:hypothetical protein